MKYLIALLILASIACVRPKVYMVASSTYSQYDGKYHEEIMSNGERVLYYVSEQYLGGKHNVGDTVADRNDGFKILIVKSIDK